MKEKTDLQWMKQVEMGETPYATIEEGIAILTEDLEIYKEAWNTHCRATKGLFNDEEARGKSVGIGLCMGATSTKLSKLKNEVSDKHDEAEARKWINSRRSEITDSDKRSLTHAAEVLTFK